jgi:LysM repeat protein
LEDILQAWSDELHMIPMVNPNYKHVGAGVAETDGYVYYILHAAYTSDGKYKPYQTPGPGTPTAVTISQYIYAVQTVTPQADGNLIHIVKPGQSLWSIAIAYGAHINEIQKLNGFASDYNTVYTGQKLLVPTNVDSPSPALSATSEPEQNRTGITAAASTEKPVSVTPTLPDIPVGVSITPTVPQNEKGSTQTVAIIIIVVFLFGTSMVATGSLWRNKTVR